MIKSIQDADNKRVASRSFAENRQAFIDGHYIQKQDYDLLDWCIETAHKCCHSKPNTYRFWQAVLSIMYGDL